MEIVERDVSGISVRPPACSSSVLNSPSDAPTSYQRDSFARGRSGRTSGISVFAGRARAQTGVLSHSRPDTCSRSHQSGSSDVRCSDDVAGHLEKVHQENTQTLSRMSPAQLEESQQHLLKTLDPNVVRFLRNRHSRSGNVARADVARADVARADVARADVARADVARADVGESVAADVDQVKYCSEADIKRSSGHDSHETVRDNDCLIRPASPARADHVGDSCMSGERAPVVRAVEDTASPADSADCDATAASDETIKQHLPFDVDWAATHWLHMDQLEVDKLRWITPAPPPVSTRDRFTARFDFSGNLLAFDADLPVESGLYHHGEQPSRAGYTIDELFTLARSAVQQQRVIGLQTIACILTKNVSGVYDACFEGTLLQLLLDAGVLFLLRFALDDASTPVVCAAVSALHALICSPPDELCLDVVFDWYRGCEQPLLAPLSPADCSEREYIDGLSQMKDDELASVDVVRALLRTDFCARIRYIVEVMCVHVSSVIGCVELLTRCCRHSSHAAALVLQCPALVTMLVSRFLCVKHKHTAVQPPAGRSHVPLHHVVKLLRVISAHSHHLSESLLNLYPALPDIMLGLIAVDLSEAILPASEVMALAVESYRLWLTWLQYGLTEDHFISFYPMLMRQLHHIYAGLDVDSSKDHGARFSHVLATCVLHVCRAAVTRVSINTSNDASGSLQWNHVTGVVDVVLCCVRKWSSQLVALKDQPPSESCVRMLSCAVTVVCSFLEARSWLDYGDQCQCVSAAVKLCGAPLLSLVSCQFVQHALHSLSDGSLLLSGVGAGGGRYPSCLPAVAALTWRSSRSPVITMLTSSSTCLLLALSRLLLSLARACLVHTPPSLSQSQPVASFIEQCCDSWISNSGLWAFLKKLCTDSQTPLSLVDNWFCRYEVRLVCAVILICSLRLGKLSGECPEKLGILLTAALRVVPCVTCDDQCIIRDLFQHVIFNQHVTRSIPAQCATVYASSLWGGRDEVLSASYRAQLYGRRVSQSVAVSRGPLVPIDWWYLPVLRLYEQHKHVAAGASVKCEGGERLNVESAGNRSADITACCLQLVLALSTVAPSLLASVSYLAHLSRTCCVFLAGDDLFLEPLVRAPLEAVLRWIFQPGRFIDFDQHVPGLSSFSELYGELLAQFEAVSYGDWLFGSVVLLALDCRQPRQMRRMLLIDKWHVLRSISTSQCQLLVSLEQCELCSESDSEVVASCRKILASRVLTESRNPALLRAVSIIAASQTDSNS